MQTYFTEPLLDMIQWSIHSSDWRDAIQGHFFKQSTAGLNSVFTFF